MGCSWSISSSACPIVFYTAGNWCSPPTPPDYRPPSCPTSTSDGKSPPKAQQGLTKSRLTNRNSFTGQNGAHWPDLGQYDILLTDQSRMSSQKVKTENTDSPCSISESNSNSSCCLPGCRPWNPRRPATSLRRGASGRAPIPAA